MKVHDAGGELDENQQEGKEGKLLFSFLEKC